MASLPSLAHAQSPTDAATPPDASDADGLVPPTLKARAEAEYPADALRDRIEGTVGLELSIDVLGNVTDAKVVQPAGHGFDEAALAAAKKFVFEPAKNNGIPTASVVQFGYEFHLPPPASAPTVVPPLAPASPPPTTPNGVASEVQTGADQSTLVLAQRPISAASSFAVQAKDFELRPIGSVQDILRVTPGLVMVQHSGGGKANQYFLRGFDADHGTDIALSIDGIPINMVSHAHGQGFSDTNFIIPEVVERVEITKGPYFADQGDFDTAGSVNLVTRENMEHSSLGFGVGGSPGYGGPSYRGLVVASPTIGTTKTLFAAELGRQDGPFENPEQWDKYKLFNKVTFALNRTSSLTIGESSYASSWHGSGQIPSRAVDSGLINRFGSIDPTEGGDTGRHQLFVTYKLRPTEKSQLDALVYAGTYRFNLYSNFTLYLDDPINGDEIEQIDRRVFYGGKASYKIRHDLTKDIKLTTTIGAQVRNDDIHEELWHTRERVQLNQERGNDVHESLVDVFANEEVQPIKWLRVVGGLRGDYLGFSVDNRVDTPGAPRSGEDGAHQFSPKASVIVTPLDRKNAQLDVYANYGNGFHSNDVRGVFTSPSVTPLTRAIGE
ncbi:MAG TPA: TonB family protein, partial [Polyangiaceae bacterium]